MLFLTFKVVVARVWEVLGLDQQLIEPGHYITLNLLKKRVEANDCERHGQISSFYIRLYECNSIVIGNQQVL